MGGESRVCEGVVVTGKALKKHPALENLKKTKGPHRLGP